MKTHFTKWTLIAKGKVVALFLIINSSTNVLLCLIFSPHLFIVTDILILLVMDILFTVGC